MNKFGSNHSFSWSIAGKTLIPLRFGYTERSYILKQICSFQLWVNLSMYDLWKPDIKKLIQTETTITVWKVSVFGTFLVRVFSYPDWIRRNAEYLSVFSPNAGKYGSEKLRIRTLFTQCIAFVFTLWNIFSSMVYKGYHYENSLWNQLI